MRIRCLDSLVSFGRKPDSYFKKYAVSEVFGFVWRGARVNPLRSVHTRRQVAATCRGDTLQRQIASCVLENFCENLSRCNRILSPQQVAQIQFDLIFCDMLQRQILLRRQRFSPKFSSAHEAICCCDVSPLSPGCCN